VRIQSLPCTRSARGGAGLGLTRWRGLLGALNRNPREEEGGVAAAEGGRDARAIGQLPTLRFPSINNVCAEKHSEKRSFFPHLGRRRTSERGGRPAAVPWAVAGAPATSPSPSLPQLLLWAAAAAAVGEAWRRREESAIELGGKKRPEFVCVRANSGSGRNELGRTGIFLVLLQGGERWPLGKERGGRRGFV
jgi:hypothetical protein